MPKFDLLLSLPVMNAAGSLGFAPDLASGVGLEQLGAFVTNPISLRPRSPAHHRLYLPYPGGFLLHSGHPNPGFREALRRYQGRWERSPLPVIVHLLAESPEELANMVPQLEGLEGVIGVEIGLPPEADAQSARELIQAAAGELPVVARLPMESALELGWALAASGAVAFSLAPPRGALPAASGKTRYGRLYGPAVFAQALYLVEQLARGLLPVIGAGGIYSVKDGEAMLAAGAMAVQLDAALWRGGW
jgi:dihydroorotate dehydrogenase (NAD+) catalytic subunit